MSTLFNYSIKTAQCLTLVLAAGQVYAADPALNGTSGYVNMPNAMVERDGTFSMGYGYDRPYGMIWASATVLPVLQLVGRYQSMSGVAGFSNVPGDYGSDYGRNKDKIFDAKLRLLEESAMLPALAVGATDVLGTRRFAGQYLVASKTFGAERNLEASIGYGRSRPTGMFAGARWSPAAVPGWAVVAEYDATDYTKDFRAADTGAAGHGKGAVVGLEYRWGWLGAQLARHRDHVSANAFVSIPLQQREYVPKLNEPKAFEQKDAPPRASLAQWEADGRPAAALKAALLRQDYKNVRVALSGGVLKLVLSNNRIANLGRAVGRAARTALAFAPAGTRVLQISYARNEQPVATYEFRDLYALSYYLGGEIDRAAFLKTVTVRAATPADAIGTAAQADLLAELGSPDGVSVDLGREGTAVQLRSEDGEANRLRVAPKLGLYFNDPSGVLRYEVDAAAYYDRRLASGLYLSGAAVAKVVENVSGVTQASNSLLPHVRTDVADYKRGARFKLNKLMLNQFAMPAEHWYLRVSGGLYEEMYRGAGAQLLYAPNDVRWAADFSADALQQRGFRGWFDSRDYSTVTALGALHYRLPSDITVTARAGRFLAKDKGVRLEAKRRFLSGIEIGAWYTRTDGKDITSPGSPSSPYHDKGVFVNIALNSMLLSDTQASAAIAVAPWTRDVGQMVNSPGDLYDALEQPRRDMQRGDGLGNFAERPDEAALASAYLDPRPLGNPWPLFRLRVEQAASTGPRMPDWAGGAGLAAGSLLAAGLLDKPVERSVRSHQDQQAVRALHRVGDALPLALVAAAGGAVAFGDERMQNVGLTALESAAAAAALAEAGKFVVGRARPDEQRGAAATTGGARRDSSFPSVHSAVAFAAVTPFAQAYDAPWLYAVAGMGAAGRVAGRQHWVSDAVAGGLLGYASGSWLWRAHGRSQDSALTVLPGVKELAVLWKGRY